MIKNINRTLIIILVICSVGLASYPHSGQKCKHDDQCLADWEICSQTTSKCVHKKIFPFNALEYLGSIFIFLQLIFSNSGGLGGGGILIATMMAFFKFDTKNAIAISNVTIFASGLFRFLLNMKQKHPQKIDGVLVEYNYAILMLPMIIVGTAIGVFVYVILPEVIIVAVLTAFLVYLFITTTIKAINVYKAEKKQRLSSTTQEQTQEIKQTPVQQAQLEDNEKGINNEIKSDEKTTPTPITVDGKVVDAFQMNENQRTTAGNLVTNKESPASKQDVDPVLTQILKRESSHLSQWRKLLLNLSMMIALLVISVIRGKGDGSMTGVIKCSPVDWFLFALLIIIGVALTLIAVFMVRMEYAQKVKSGYKFIPGDLVCSPKVVIKLTVVAFGCGFAAGSLGLGTGIILNPTLMQLGLHPVPASATGMYMVTYSTLSASIVVTVFGRMNMAYALNSILLVLAGTYVGIRIQNMIIHQWKRNSLIVLLLDVCILWCLVAIPSQVFNAVGEKAKQGIAFMQFTDYCSTS